MKKDLDVDAECIARLTQYGTQQCVTVWYVRVRDCTYVMVCYDTVRSVTYGMVLYVRVRYATVHYHMLPYCLIVQMSRYSTVWFGMIWYNTLRYGMFQKCYATVRYVSVRSCWFSIGSQCSVVA